MMQSERRVSTLGRAGRIVVLGVLVLGAACASGGDSVGAGPPAAVGSEGASSSPAEAGGERVIEDGGPCVKGARVRLENRTPGILMTTGDGISVLDPDTSSSFTIRPDTRGGWPVWSPDYRRIMFGEDGSIYQMGADGSNVRRVVEWDRSPDGFLGAFTWSPDGTRIAFGRGTQLVVADTDGSNERVIADDFEGGDRSYSWSPNGRCLVYVDHVPRSDSLEVRLADLETRQTSTVTSRCAEAPRWSPAEDLIACSGSSGLLLVTPEGTVVRTVDKEGSMRAWSPGGSRLLFIKDNNVHVVDADGGNVKVLARVDLDPIWSPDGSRIAVNDAGLRLIPVDGSGAGIRVADSTCWMHWWATSAVYYQTC